MHLAVPVGEVVVHVEVEVATETVQTVGVAPMDPHVQPVWAVQQLGGIGLFSVYYLLEYIQSSICVLIALGESAEKHICPESIRRVC